MFNFHRSESNTILDSKSSVYEP